MENVSSTKKPSDIEMVRLLFVDKTTEFNILLQKDHGLWLTKVLPKLSVNNSLIMTLKELQETYTTAGLTQFEQFINSKPMAGLFDNGLLLL